MTTYICLTEDSPPPPVLTPEHTPTKDKPESGIDSKEKCESQPQVVEEKMCNSPAVSERGAVENESPNINDVLMNNAQQQRGKKPAARKRGRKAKSRANGTTDDLTNGTAKKESSSKTSKSKVKAK